MAVGTLHQTALYRTIWRWHFYAGLFVLPFILLLSVTGGIYLFKPQIDRWEEREFQGLSARKIVSPNVQLEAALRAFPGSSFQSYRLPRRPDDAAAIHLGLVDGKSMRDVFVSPQGQVFGAIDPEDRVSEWVRSIHGELLAGKWGGYLVELAGSWAIVMILSGLWLWWPNGRGPSGVLWPRLSLGQRAFWRDIHAVTGFWVSTLALVLLVTALPWAGIWGNAFKTVRAEMGWVSEPSDWKIGSGEHGEHDHAAMMASASPPRPVAGLADIVAKARAETSLPYPVLVKPPGAAGPAGSTAQGWTVMSDTQNRPLNVTIVYDPVTGVEQSRKGFGDKHVIDRVVGYGIAWHEGQLFGWVNQLIGLLTAIALIVLVVSGFVLWRRRKPEDGLGAPLPARLPVRAPGVVAITFLLAAVLPLLAASLLLLLLFDRLLLPRLPRLARWLGAESRQPV